MSQVNEAQSAPARQTDLNRKFDRRVILKVAAMTALTAALGDTLFTAAPWLDYDGQTRRLWDTPFHREGTLSAQMRELIRYATLAPSGHNAQPWKFAAQGNTIRIIPDYARRLPIVDPQDRELWISLGCALENLILAAEAIGYGTEITYPVTNADFLTLHLRPSPARGTASLFEAIPHRQSTRSLYNGHSISLNERKRIEAIHSDTGISMQIFTDTDPKEVLLEYIKAGDRRQYGNPLFVKELISWLRFNKPEALHTLDGLYSRCTGNPNVPRWLGRRFVTSGSAGKQSVTDEKAVRSSSGLIVIATAQDDKRHWIDTGRLYERLALTLTGLDIKMAFLNQPMEVPELRSQLGGYLHLGEAQPQLLLRFGYAAQMPRSLRRRLEEVLV